MIRDEKGSAFLLVVFMLLLFTLLGVAILGATVGGAMRSQKSEDNVQTLHLADKALSEALARIITRFEGKSFKPEQLEAGIQKFISEAIDNDYYGAQSSELDADKAPGYAIDRICIANGAPVGTDLLIRNKAYCDPAKVDSSGESYLRTIRITAKATVNGVTRKLTQDVTLNSFPDFLYYAMGSSEGDVVINGSPYFKGNIYAGRNLRIQNVANYDYKGNVDLAAPTQFLYVKPGDVDSAAIGGVDAADLEAGQVHIQNVGNIGYREQAGNENTPPYTPLTKESLEEEANKHRFHGLSVQETETKKFLSINVGETFVDKAFDSTGSLDENLRDQWVRQYRSDAASWTQDPGKELMKKVENQYQFYYSSRKWKYQQPAALGENPTEAQQEAYTQQMNELKAALANMTGPIIIDGDLTLGKELKDVIFANKDMESTALEKKKWLIVNGDLTVQNDDSDPVDIRANILVVGKVTLSGKMNIDSTMYTLSSAVNKQTGDAKNIVMDAEIRGVTMGGVQKVFVLIANGPIEMYRVDSFQSLSDNSTGKEGYDRASNYTLDGFFYTDRKAELYGVGSLFWIHGGFFARAGIEVNAVLGNTTEKLGTEKDPLTGEARSQIIFEAPQSNLTEQQARFVIDYNGAVFNQGTGLPRVDKVRVQIGKKKLEQNK
ncbi:hypothetical protein ACFFSY_04610 [Paenibacillus aurantiacus]|uniref:Type 4 fimbrial biogenesis protein PilX N-terminal domain-containing protein n=1 Tax=Paenibacillus aurantiacus TaxID=1936118 RepID=A0ABV5KJ06_9BACL